MTKHTFLSAVSAWKTGNTTLAEEEKSERIQDAFEEYKKVLIEKEQCDFDDLLLKTKLLFRQYHQNGKKAELALVKKFSYLLVDEFQNICPLQYELIMEWNRLGKELFVIGDPDQSIYGFRGADTSYFGKLKEAFPQIRMISLEDNYRSTEKILRGATGVISHNPGGERKLNPYKKGGFPIRVIQTKSKTAEAVFVAKEITRLIGGIDMVDAELQKAKNETGKNRTFGDIAVLYRTHYQARLLEKCLAQEGIPYMVYGREDFLEKEIVRGTISFFSSLMYPDNISYRTEAQEFLWDLQKGKMADSIYECMAQKYEGKWQKQKPVKLLKEWVIDLGKEEDPHLNKLLGMAVLYEKLPDFLNSILLGEEGDIKRCNGKMFSSDMVRLMTAHGSKGKEFPVVFLYGAEEGEFPLEREKYETNAEEERRLFFVAMTRAKEELIITYQGEPSCFIEEISQDCIEKEQVEPQKREEKMKQMSLFDFI